MKYLAHACAAVAVLIATACGSLGSEDQPMNQPDAATQQFQQLMQRPDIDQVTTNYEDMYRKIREQLTATFGDLTWHQTRQPTNSACGEEFSAIDVAGRSDAEERGLGNWGASAPVPVNRWNVALSLVDSVARNYGFNSGPIVTKNNPSEHYVTFYDPHGAQLTLSSAIRSSMTLRTGCHLTPEAKQRGSLAPTPSY